jgi:hypothetical protein
VSVGPDEVFKIKNFKKDNHLLYLDTVAKIKNKKYHINYCINGLDNSFKLDILDIFKVENKESSVEKASAPYFYFYIQSDCKQCNSSYVYSSDLELNFLEKKVISIGIEQEDIFFLKYKDKYQVTMDYDQKEMIISRCDKNGSLLGKPFNTTLVNLDLSNPKKAVKKIKTIIVFS